MQYFGYHAALTTVAAKAPLRQQMSMMFHARYTHQGLMKG